MSPAPKPMPAKTRLSYLRNARDAIDRVAQSLNTDTDVCAHCHLTRKKNWTEHQIYEQLNGALTRVDTAIRKLAAPSNEPGTPAKDK
jgi:hypothetical protein